MFFLLKKKKNGYHVGKNSNGCYYEKQNTLYNELKRKSKHYLYWKKIRKLCYLKRILINLHTFHFLTFKVFLLDSLRQIQNDYKFKTKYVQTWLVVELLALMTFLYGTDDTEERERGRELPWDYQSLCMMMITYSASTTTTITS